MLTVEEAKVVIQQNLPDGEVKGVIDWDGSWLFSVFMDDPDEGDLDPFYAVNKRTGAFSGFSIVGDQDPIAIIEAFESSSVKHTNAVEDILAHYGVKGMRWGVRKAPESGSEKKSSGAKTSQTLESLSNRAKPFVGPFIPRANLRGKALQAGINFLTNQEFTKAAFATTVKAAHSSPLAVAGYAVSALDTGAYRVPVTSIRNAARGGWKQDKSLADPNLTVDGIQKKVVSGINKDFPGLGTTNNCLRCTYAYEMRRRGYDVAATKTAFASGQTAMGVRVMTKSARSKTAKIDAKRKGIMDWITQKGPSSTQIMNTLAKQPDGSRGDLQMRWKGGLGGHSVAYEIVKGKPVVFDTQSGKTYSTPTELSKLIGAASSLKFNRLDNKDLNSLGLTAWLKDPKD